MAKKEDGDTYVGIAGAVGGTTCGMIALIVLFAREYAWAVIPVAAIMAFMGIVLGAFAHQKVLVTKKKK